MAQAEEVVLEALGDRHRRAIVRRLAKSPLPVHSLAAELPISRPAVSRHLRLLKDAGLVVDVAVGNERIYQLRAEGVEVLQKYVDDVWGKALTRYRLLADNAGRTPGRRG
jgi:DNA-binding transcriptional ArsR family regulator